jgi:hypothetical protein
MNETNSRLYSRAKQALKSNIDTPRSLRVFSSKGLRIRILGLCQQGGIVLLTLFRSTIAPSSVPPFLFSITWSTAIFTTFRQFRGQDAIGTFVNSRAGKGPDQATSVLRHAVSKRGNGLGTTRLPGGRSSRVSAILVFLTASMTHMGHRSSILHKGYPVLVVHTQILALECIRPFVGASQFLLPFLENVEKETSWSEYD